jgi:lipopolysaccharide transport system permease protein
MKAGVEQSRVTESSRPGQLDVELRFRNDGPDAWTSSGGYSAGYQVFDAETGVLILDGERTNFSDPVAPGAAATVTTRIELGETPGRFLVFLSPLAEGVAWFFDRGSPFLLIDAEVTEAGTTVHRSEVTSMRAVGLRRAMRSVGRAFTYPFATLFRNGPLIRSLVRRDIAGRYRGSYGGMFWTLFHPLLMMLTYYFVFGLVLQTRFGSDARPSNFVMYFLAGMLPWLAFSEAVGRAPTTVIEHGSFVKKLLFPVEALPVTLVLAGLVSEAFGVAIFVTGMLFFGYTPTIAVLYLPLLLIPQFLLTLGLSWLLAALGVYFRDLGQLIGFLLTAWFFTTPICYPETSLPQSYLWLFELNPIYVLVKSYRAIFLEASAPPWTSLGYLTAGSAFLFIAGHAWFYKLKKSFADVV